MLCNIIILFIYYTYILYYCNILIKKWNYCNIIHIYIIYNVICNIINITNTINLRFTCYSHRFMGMANGNAPFFSRTSARCPATNIVHVMRYVPYVRFREPVRVINVFFYEPLEDIFYVRRSQGFQHMLNIGYR